MADNFRHAQYDNGGVQIDDPQTLDRLSSRQVDNLQILASEGGISYREAPIANTCRRIINPGRNLFAFTDHTAFTASGAEAAAYTLSTVSGYNGIAAGDTPDGVAIGSKTGSTAMVKLVCNGTQAGAANYFITSASNLALTTVDEKFGLWVYFSCDITTNSTWMPSISINVSTANTFNGDAADYTFGFNSNQCRQGWNFLVLKCDNSTHPYGISKSGVGTAKFATTGLNRFRIYMTVPNGKTLTCYFDTLWSNFSTKPAVAITFDIAGEPLFQNYGLSALSEFGFQGVVFILPNGSGANDNTNNRLIDYNTGPISGNAQIACLDALYAAGWDISNHTLNHTNTSNGGSVRTQLLTDAQLQYQVIAGTAWQLGHGYERGKEFYAAPQGAWDTTTILRLQTWGYKLLRMGQQGLNRTRTIYGYDQLGNMGWYGIDGLPGGAVGSYNQWIADIQTLFDYGADVILGAHSVIADVGTVTGATTTPNTVTMYYTQLRMLCQWLKTKVDARQIVVGSLTDIYYERV